jgi:hypothetical protein
MDAINGIQALSLLDPNRRVKLLSDKIEQEAKITKLEAELGDAKLSLSAISAELGTIEEMFEKFAIFINTTAIKTVPVNDQIFAESQSKIPEPEVQIEVVSATNVEPVMFTHCPWAESVPENEPEKEENSSPVSYVGSLGKSAPIVGAFNKVIAPSNKPKRAPKPDMTFESFMESFQRYVNFIMKGIDSQELSIKCHSLEVDHLTKLIINNVIEKVYCHRDEFTEFISKKGLTFFAFEKENFHINKLQKTFQPLWCFCNSLARAMQNQNDWNGKLKEEVYYSIIDARTVFSLMETFLWKEQHLEPKDKNTLTYEMTRHFLGIIRS